MTVGTARREVLPCVRIRSIFGNASLLPLIVANTRSARSPTFSLSTFPSSSGCCNDDGPRGPSNPGRTAVDLRRSLTKVPSGDSALSSASNPTPPSRNCATAWASLVTLRPSRALRRLGITRKKKTLHAQERDRPEVQAQRVAFTEKLAGVDPDHLVFVDEFGATTAMTRRYGWAPEGARVEATAPGAWQNVTLIVGLRPKQVVAPFVFEGATDGAAMATYVPQVLVPALQPGDVVVWDNLQPHKNAQVIAAIEAAGARVEPLPVYSPDLTPIEELGSKVKEFLRSVGARTTQTVMGAVGAALEQITPRDIKGWFQHRCAYALH